MLNASDRVYTPDWLADALLSFAPNKIEGPIVDPAVGEGALLLAAVRKFGPSVTIAGLDANGGVVQTLMRRHPEWILSTANSLSKRSVLSSRVWRACRAERPGLLVLNPPFSFRGGGGVEVVVAGRRAKCSPAVAFLYTSLQIYRPRSGAVCLLPAGALANVRDVPVWQELEKHYSFASVETVRVDAFEGRRVSTVIVNLLPKSSAYRGRHVQADPVQSPLNTGEVVDSTRCSCVEVIRGKFPVHKVGDPLHKESRFFHSTDLGTDNLEAVRRAPARLISRGEFVLLNRVGVPRVPVVRDFGVTGVVFSDCMFALRPKVGPASELLSLLRSNFDALGSGYLGSGAPHITLARLCGVLRALGLTPTVVDPADSLSDCTCIRNRVVSL